MCSEQIVIQKTTSLRCPYESSTSIWDTFRIWKWHLIESLKNHKCSYHTLSWISFKNFVWWNTNNIWMLLYYMLKCSICQNQGIPFLSSLADATRRIALSCIVFLWLVWPKINHSHTCLWLLTTLIVIGLRIASGKYYIWAKCERGIHIYWKIMKRRKLLYSGKARQGKTRLDKIKHHNVSDNSDDKRLSRV